MKDTQLIYPSTATTADHNVDFTTSTRGGFVVINVSADPAAASVTFTVQGLDPASTATWTILQSVAVTGVGTTVLRIHPNLTAAANTITNDILPQAVRVNCNHVDTDSITYSIGFIGVD